MFFNPKQDNKNDKVLAMVSVNRNLLHNIPDFSEHFISQKTEKLTLFTFFFSILFLGLNIKQSESRICLAIYCLFIHTITYLPIAI